MKNKGLFVLYSKAGSDFLAYKLEKIFSRIENAEDMALHNDILKDVLDIVESKETGFFRDMASLILRKKPERQDRFLVGLAKKIIHIGQSNT